MRFGDSVLALAVAVAMAACATNDNEATKALSDEGFEDIQITDRGALFAALEGCDDKDMNWYRAAATNPRGRRVSMLVCCGGPLQFKGCTVRSK